MTTDCDGSDTEAETDRILGIGATFGDDPKFVEDFADVFHPDHAKRDRQSEPKP